MNIMKFSLTPVLLCLVLYGCGPNPEPALVAPEDSEVVSEAEEVLEPVQESEIPFEESLDTVSEEFEESEEPLEPSTAVEPVEEESQELKRADTKLLVVREKVTEERLSKAAGFEWVTSVKDGTKPSNKAGGNTLSNSQINKSASEKFAKATAKAEAEAKERAEAKAKAKAMKKAKMEAEALVIAKAEAEAVMKAKAEEEAAAKVKAATEALAQAKREEEVAAKAKAEAERMAKVEAVAKAKVEADRIAKAEAAAKEKAQAEAVRMAKEKAEAERMAKAKAEADAVVKAKAEADRIAKAEAASKAKAQAQASRMAKEKAEAARVAKAKAEAERIAREKQEKYMAQLVAEKEKAEAEAELAKKAKADAEAKLKQAQQEQARIMAAAEMARKRAEQEALAKAKAEAKFLQAQADAEARLKQARAESDAKMKQIRAESDAKVKQAQEEARMQAAADKADQERIKVAAVPKVAKTTRVSSPSGSIRLGKLVQGSTKNGAKGLTLNSAGTIKGLKGKKIELAAYFFDQSGAPLKDLDKKFRSSRGQVYVGKETVVPSDAYSLSQGLFLPYDQLHIKRTAEKMLQVEVVVWEFSQGRGRKLVTTPRTKFSVAPIGAPAPVIGTLSGNWTSSEGLITIVQQGETLVLSGIGSIVPYSIVSEKWTFANGVLRGSLINKRNFPPMTRVWEFDMKLSKDGNTLSGTYHRSDKAGNYAFDSEDFRWVRNK